MLIKWIYLDVTSCLLTLTSLTLVQIELSLEPLSVILTSKEGACLGPALIRVGDFYIVRINFLNFFIPSNKVTLAVSSHFRSVPSADITHSHQWKGLGMRLPYW